MHFTKIICLLLSYLKRPLQSADKLIVYALSDYMG